MVTFGDDLGADHHVDLVLGHGADGRLRFGRPMHGVAGCDRHARVREHGREFLRHPLHAGAAGDKAGLCVTLRAALRQGGVESAMVADELAMIAMLHQPCRALAARHLVSARFAKRERGIAAAVEEQHRLLASRQRCRQRFAQRLRQPGAGLGAGVAQIDQADFRHHRRAVAPRQLQPFVPPGGSVHVGFERRRRARQHHRTILDACAHHRHVARVIDGAFFLLVGLLVLLIDDDEAEFGKRQEQRRARAHHHPRFALHHRAPGAAALLWRQVGMPFGRAAAEPLGKPVEELNGERDFRQQDERLPAAAKRFRNRGEIGFRLARAGDAVQQRCGKSLAGDRAAQSARRGFLLQIERGGRETRVRAGERRELRQRDFGKRPGIDQPTDDRGRRIRFLGKSGGTARHSVTRDLEHALARRGHPRRHCGPAHVADTRDFRRKGLRHAQRQRQHEARRGEGVSRHPIDEVAE